MPLPAGASRPTPRPPRTTAQRPRAAAAAPAYRQYVALGDSWSADVVFANQDGAPDTTYAPVDCAQSHHNYPKLVAASLGVPIRDATCGSATTDDFTHPQDLPAGGQNPPQFDRLTPRTDLVTVGIGGNDAGIAGAGMDCLNALPVANPLPDGTVPSLPDNPVPIIGSEPPLGGCKAKYTAGGHDRLSERIQASEPKLVSGVPGDPRASRRRPGSSRSTTSRWSPTTAATRRCPRPTRTWPTSTPSSSSSTRW